MNDKQLHIIQNLTGDQLKLLGKGRNNAIFSFKIEEYKSFAVRIPILNCKL